MAFEPALESQRAPKLQPALLAGLFIGVLSSLPFVNALNCCCLWVITGGVLAAYVMQQNHPLPVTIGEGAGVGLLAGLFGAILQIGLALLLEPLLGQFTGGIDGLMRGGRQDMPPEMRRLLNEIGPRGLLLIGSVMYGMLSLVFAMLGGILGVVLFRKPAPPAPPPPAADPRFGSSLSAWPPPPVPPAAPPSPWSRPPEIPTPDAAPAVPPEEEPPIDTPPDGKAPDDRPPDEKPPDEKPPGA